MHFLAGAVCAILYFCAAVSAQEPKCTSEHTFQIIPRLDCKGYYLCVFGKPVKMPDCLHGSSFSIQAHVCVPEDSIYADCKVETRPPIPDSGPLTTEEQCQVKGGLIPHPTECQAYYNCSDWYETVPRYYEQHMMECPYPLLFDAEAGRCDHFENVKCGNRQEFKNGCDYRRNQCPVGSHCIPCSTRYPSCEGKPDGIHAHEVKLWSPYYIVCYKKRMVIENVCPADSNGRAQLFHPDLNECVSLEKIPREHGGMMPDCTNMTDGFYLDDFGRCDRYTVCKGGKFLNYVKCMSGESFDALLQVCVPSEKVCGPCGNRSDC